MYNIVLGSYDLWLISSHRTLCVDTIISHQTLALPSYIEALGAQVHKLEI